MSGMWQERLDTEFNYLVDAGWLVAGATNGTYKLSAKGLDRYNRLYEMLSVEAQVLMSMKLNGNVDTTVDTIKGYMQ